MRHIRLFENFEQDKTVDTSDLLFDWLPFDTEVNNPINSSVPTEITPLKLIEYCNANQEIGKVGLYIAHKKNPAGGFNRYLTTSTNPLLLESATFDKEFNKVNEVGGISAATLGSFVKGNSMLSRFGLFKK